MSWEKSYAIVRVSAEGQSSVVHQAETLKDSKYWLNYIALPGDCMFQTPKHAKQKGSDGLEYFAHLEARGKILYDEAKWRATVGSNITLTKDPE
ncbi:MAG: hypothetical protein PHC51_12700 [bacterium]|nr:hypothetical protein [bacterium]